MKRLLTGLLGLLFTLCPSLAEDTAAPWTKAQAVLEGATPDLSKGGIRAMNVHAADFERALADADKSFAVPPSGDIVVLSDGAADTLSALMLARKAHPDRNAVAVPDPYPYIALYLGSYYNEVGKFEDALRVFDRERALEPNSLNRILDKLASERAVSLAQLHRLPEALAAYDEGLKIADLDDKSRARMLRGRGFVLTDMERLDEAEAAYTESLKFDPSSAVAKNELEYIAKLRAGGNKAPSEVVLPNPASKSN